MEAANALITIREALTLTSLGIAPQFVTLTHVTMESEKYICVRETSPQNSVVIIDMAMPMQPLRRPITADSALMNPNTRILALKAQIPGTTQDHLQIFNIEAKTKIKSHQMPEQVVFWKWITPKLLGLVTETSVYHWSFEGDSKPTKMFDRSANLANNQIINYRCDPAEKWLVLIGGAPGTPEKPQLVKGNMQLFSVDKQCGQALKAHAASFATFKVVGNENPSTLICFASKTIKAGQITAKLHVMELDAQPGKPCFSKKKQADLFFPPDLQDDFPVAMQVSQKYGLIYVITKLGTLFVHVLETAAAIYTTRISPDPIFLTAESSSTGGFYAINRSGQVLHATVNDAAVVPFVSGQSVYELANQTHPVLKYFGALLKQRKIDAFESFELSRHAIDENKMNLLENLLMEDKLVCSENLGDLVKTVDNDMALKIYIKARATPKVVAAFAERREFDKILKYSKQVGYTPDYLFLLQTILRTDPQGAVNFALMMSQMEGGCPVDYNTITDLFLQRNMIREATAFLLDVLKPNLPEHAFLQTNVLEINLVTYPNVADAILANGMFSHYDRPRIAQLCEKAGLYLRALQHYSELPDIKRVIVNTHAIEPQALVEFFGTLSREWALECMKDLLVVSLRGNLQIVVQAAKEYSKQLGVDACIKLFEQSKSYEGLYFFLGPYLSSSEDPDIHFKYIEAAARTGQFQEVERVTGESNFYDAEKTKNFLMEAKLSDVCPLIKVCDRFGFVPDLIHYLYTNNMLRYIKGYVQKVNPGNAPLVVGQLLDDECPEDFIKGLILSVRSLLPVEPLVDECEKRNRLRLLTQFLEHLVSEGSQDVHVHNALGKIIIDSNNNPEHFLTTNPFYDSRVVGKYCEKRDPTLAVVAYRCGQCDEELINVTNKNSLFKLQASYVVERMDGDLWDKVLQPENEYRRQLIDQVVSTALPESKSPEPVSAAVKALMSADLPQELIEHLEKIVLQNSALSGNLNRQKNQLLAIGKAGQLHLVKPYMAAVQSNNVSAVNEALNELYVEEKDYESLPETVDMHDNNELHVEEEDYDKLDEPVDMPDEIKELASKVGWFTSLDIHSLRNVLAGSGIDLCLTKEKLVVIAEAKYGSRLSPFKRPSLRNLCKGNGIVYKATESTQDLVSKLKNHRKKKMIELEAARELQAKVSNEKVQEQEVEASPTNAEISNEKVQEQVDASSTNAEVFFSVDTTIDLSFECEPTFEHEPFECVPIPRDDIDDIDVERVEQAVSDYVSARAAAKVRRSKELVEAATKARLTLKAKLCSNADSVLGSFVRKNESSDKEGMKPPSFDGLTGASKLSDRKGKESSDGQQGGGTSAPFRGGHKMAKEAFVLEELDDYTRSLLRSANDILDGSIQRTRKIPQRDVYQLKDAVQEFGRRMGIQARHLEKKNSIMKSRKGKYHTKIKALETLANEASEDAEIAIQAYHNVLSENQKLFDKVQELKGNIRVYCRVRPFRPSQDERASTVHYVGDSGKILIRDPLEQGKDGRMFKFNKVFGTRASQAEVFSDIKPLIRSVIDGVNVCIFAYGQTGSGKTCTMSGLGTAEEERGINYRALNDLFKFSREGFSYNIQIQMIEIYNDEVRDLLSDDVVLKKLDINSSHPSGLVVPGASIHPVKSESDVLSLMEIGQTKRAVGATELNERSSRSHSILIVHVKGLCFKTGSISRGSLQLVDLAGSGRVKQSKVIGDRFKEAAQINKSLSALSDVMFALGQKSAHVPYRNSKLTHVLQSSLGGKAKTVMFVHIKPDIESLSETMNTLKFAERVSGVELGAVRSNTDGKELLEQVLYLKDRLSQKDAIIEQLLKDRSKLPSSSSEISQQIWRLSGAAGSGVAECEDVPIDNLLHGCSLAGTKYSVGDASEVAADMQKAPARIAGLFPTKNGQPGNFKVKPWETALKPQGRTLTGGGGGAHSVQPPKRVAR